MEEKKLTGYPSIDKPWLKYYTEEQINATCPEMSAYEYVKYCNRDNLDNTAIRSMEGSYTYRELFSVIDDTAKSLIACGHQKEDILLAMLPPISHEVFLFYGADAAGGAISYIVPGTTPNEICHVINTLKAKFLFLFDAFMSSELEQMVYSQTNLEHFVVVGFSRRKFMDSRTLDWNSFLTVGHKSGITLETRNPNEMVFLAKTGGSTGKPKHVMLSGKAINEAVHKLYVTQKYHKGGKWLRLWPLFSSTAAVANSHLPLCAGLENILSILPPSMEGVDALILKEQPNHLILIPQLLDMLDSSPLLKNQNLQFIETIACGGMAITSHFEQKAHRFFDDHHISAYLGYGWGCTESSADGSGRISYETDVEGTVGIPYMNTIVSVFDPDDLSEKQYGEEGELCICSGSLMLGYYNSPELTAKVLKRHDGGKVWLHTGDLGTVDQNGFVRVSGRMTRATLIYPNAKIFPGAMEEEISHVEGVLDVAIGILPDKEHEGCGKTVCFIAPQEGYSAEIVQRNVVQMCAEHYMENVRPLAVYVRPALPLTPVGKVNYLALEKEAAEAMEG